VSLPFRGIGFRTLQHFRQSCMLPLE
jgi:hypothetical protein